MSNPSDPFVDLNLGITPRAGSTKESVWPFTTPLPPRQTPEEAAQGRMCRFHPDRPAVRAEAFAPMCADCAARYEATKNQPSVGTVWPEPRRGARVIPSHRHEKWFAAVESL